MKDKLKIIIATSNKGKVKEIKEILGDYNIFVYTDFIDKIDIIEDGDTYKANAIIKAETVFNALKSDDVVVISDDSGISVEALDWEPGVFSARYAGENADDTQNLDKLINSLKDKKISKSTAFYTCAVAIKSKDSISCVHGWMHGNVITQKRGSNGFGYDPIFIPEGFDKTVAQLSPAVKKEISHRTKAFHLAKYFLEGVAW